MAHKPLWGTNCGPAACPRDLICEPHLCCLIPFPEATSAYPTNSYASLSPSPSLWPSPDPVGLGASGCACRVGGWGGGDCGNIG